MKHGSTTTHLKQKDCQLSRQQLVKAVQSDQKLNSGLTRSAFWDAHSILFIDCLEKGKTINSDYYMALLDRSSTEIKKKRPHMQKKKVLFHQDNAPCHKSMKMMVKLNELSFELLPHPPYSSDPFFRAFLEQRRIILQKRHREVKEAFE